MLDVVHVSSALLAVIGLLLWFWSGRIGVSAAGDDGVMARRKRQIRRVAICAAVVSALLQASVSGPATDFQDVELWASAAPAPLSSVG